MVSDTTFEGPGVTITLETDMDATEAVAEIRQTCAGLIYHQMLTRETSDGKTRIGILVLTNQTITDLLTIQSRLEFRFKILAGTMGNWKFEASHAPTL